MPMRFLPRPILAILAALTTAGAVVAQEFPSRPITVVVPFAAGGPTDTLARILAERLKEHLGQTVIVENVVGAAGSVGVGRVARAAPDGYTLSLGNSGTHVLNGAMQSLAYDLMKDFEPVAFIADNPVLLVGKNALPAADLRELIAWINANAGKITSGTSGVGAPSHVSGIYFQHLTNTQLQFVPYRGAGPALQDLIAGQIDLMFDQVSNSLPHTRAGKLKAYAIAAKTRSVAASEIPTVDEAGLPGFHVSVWHGLWAPKGTSSAVISKLNVAINKTLDEPAVGRRLAELGQEIPFAAQRTTVAFSAYHKAEIDKWWPIIKAANIK